jgi:hypothetical protein
MPDTPPTQSAPFGTQQQRRRGRPFPKGNPGRRLGAKNKATLIAASLLQGEAEQLVRTAVEIAKGGDKDMLKFLLSRVLPKERSVRLDLPVLDLASDAIDAIAALTHAVSAGELTPSEGAAVGSLIASFSRAIDISELAERIGRLEAELQPS